MRWPWQRDKGTYFYLETKLDVGSILFQELRESAQRGYWCYIADELMLLKRLFNFIENNLQGLFLLDGQNRLKKCGVVNLSNIPQGKIELSDRDLTMLKNFVIDRHRIMEGDWLVRLHFTGGKNARYIKYSPKLGLYLD